MTVSSLVSPIRFHSTCAIASLAILGLVPASLAAPTIFNATETAAAPDLIGLQGSGFGSSPAVRLAVVASSGTAGTPTTLALSNLSDTYVSARLTTGLPAGLYQAWVEDVSGAASAAVFINQARITSLEFSEIDPNRQFRIFGRNLRLAGTTPTVRFVDTTTSLSTAGSVLTGGDKYIVTVQAPATMVAGHVYQIYYSNGYGGPAGEVASSSLFTARAPGTDAFALGVPWGNDFAALSTQVHNIKTDFSSTATGDGVADDTAALQTAIDTVSGSGGGVIYLPTGTYVVRTFTGGTALTIKSNVVLKGDGQGSTVIAFAAPSSVASVAGMIQAGAAVNTIGLMDMTLKNTTASTSGTTLNYFFSTNGSDTARAFFLRVTLDGGAWATGGLRLVTGTAGGQMLVSGCTIKNLRKDGRTLQLKDYGDAPCDTSYVAIRNNTIPNFNIGLQLGGKNIIYEGNTLSYDGSYYNYLVNTLGQSQAESNRNRINVSGPNNVVLNNTFNHTGLPYVNMNDGENILCEDHGQNHDTDSLGMPSSVTATSLSDTTKSWLPNKYTGWNIAIVDGTGAGQVRTVTSNTTSTATLDAAWTLPPDSSSKYVLTRLNVPHLLVKGNTMQDKDHTMFLWLGAYDLAFVNNTSSNSSDFNLRSRIEAGTPRCAIVLKALVADNSLTATSSAKPSVIRADSSYSALTSPFDPSAETRWSTGQFLVEIRRNTVTSLGTECFCADASLPYGETLRWHPAGNASPAAVQGIIFDGNTAINALTAYGWTPGIDQMAVGSGTDSGVFRHSYNLMARDGILTSGTVGGGAFSNGSISLGSMDVPLATTVEEKIKATGTTAVNIFTNNPPGNLNVTRHSTGQFKVFETPWTSGAMYTPASYQDGLWHHFAWASDGTTNRIYVDGVLAQTATKSGARSLGLGKMGDDLLAGSLDEVRMWNTTRSQADLLKYKDTQLAGDEPGLIQYWRLSENGGGLVKSGILSDEVAAGLVAYWRLDENTGATLEDNTTYGNDATLAGGYTWISGCFGPAVKFNGSSAYASVPDNSSLDMVDAMSIHARVRLDSISPTWNLNYRGIVTKGDLSTGSAGWELGTYANNTAPTMVGFYLRRGSGSSVVTAYGTTGLATGRYYAVDVTYDSVSHYTKLYVDGQLQTSLYNTGAMTASTASLLIGRRASGGGIYFDGAIDDVKIFHRTLSAQEVGELSTP